MAVLQVGDDGVLRVPVEMLPGAQPRSRFEVELVGDVTVLRLAVAERPLWRHASSSERAEAFQRWACAPRPAAPDLPAECLRREGMYE